MKIIIAECFSEIFILAMTYAVGSLSFKHVMRI